MSASHEKWNRIYADRDVGRDEPPSVLIEHAYLLPTRGRALDLACGLGRASVFLAKRGLQVTAWDSSSVAIDKLRAYASEHALMIEPQRVDVMRAPFPEGAYDVICVHNFLIRSACTNIARALKPNGLLVYQTASLESRPDARHKNPDYCLRRGELLRLFDGLQPVLYREHALIGDVAHGTRNQVTLIAQQPIAKPPFFVDWVRRVTDNDHPAALSLAIERHRARISSLDDRLGHLVSDDPSERAHEWGIIEDADVVIVPDSCPPHDRLRVLVVLRGASVMPSDLPEATLLRVGEIVEIIEDALRQKAGAERFRCWTPHPDDRRSRRVHLCIDPDLKVRDVAEKKTLWANVTAHIARADIGSRRVRATK